MASKEAVVDHVLDQFDEGRASFRNTVQSTVRARIEKASRGDCVGIVECSPPYGAGKALFGLFLAVTGVENFHENEQIVKVGPDRFCTQRRYSWKQPQAWAKRFIIMSKHKDKTKPPRVDESSGWYLESCLNQPIQQEIQRVWGEFYQQRSDIICTGLIGMMKNDPVVVEALAKQIIASIAKAGKPLTKELQKSMVHFLTQEVGGHLAGQTMNQIGGMVGHTVANSAATAAGHSLVAGLSQSLVHSLGAALTHYVATHTAGAVLKSVLMAAFHSAVQHGILTAFTATLIGLFGAHLAAMAAWALVPLILVFAAKEINDFPRDLAKEVAPSVADVVIGEFRPSNRSILEKLYRKTLVDNAKGLAMKLAKEAPFVKQLEEAATDHLKEWEEEGKDFAHVSIMEVKQKTEDDCIVM